MGTRVTIEHKGGVMGRRILRAIMGVAITGLVAFGWTGVSAAQPGPPCPDGTDTTGRQYAHGHIVEHAHEGTLGQGGHKPGTHQGFSLCVFGAGNHPGNPGG